MNPGRNHEAAQWNAPPECETCGGAGIIHDPIAVPSTVLTCPDCLGLGVREPPERDPDAARQERLEGGP